MVNYSLALVIKNSLDEKERKELLESITKKFNKTIKEDLWGTRSLSYKIKHQDKAFYAYFEFESESDQIKSLDKQIKLNEDIIRYLILKKD